MRLWWKGRNQVPVGSVALSFVLRSMERLADEGERYITFRCMRWTEQVYQRKSGNEPGLEGAVSARSR